jgi:transporter family-2 protein
MLLGGLCIALQSPTNALLGQALGSPISAALVSFVVGTAFLGFVVLLFRQPLMLGAASKLPWYAWLGGVYGAILVAAIAYGARKIGVASSLTIALASQLLLAVLLDHFGALGLPRQPMTWVKAAGLAMVMGGALLIRR